MYEKIEGVPRLLMNVELKPVQGDRFQPTGFADLGAAVYERPNGPRMLLVESAQSVANRLEHACLHGNGPRLAPQLDGLPYILVKLTGAAEAETSSLVEAHRINSPFIISDLGFREAFTKATGYAKGKPIEWSKIAGALFRQDPNSLLHGVFMANYEDGRIRVPRMLTGFIEAEDIREAASGGVKNNPLDPSGSIRAANYDKNVYGNVPYSRMEYTAKRITAYFNMDLSLLDGFGLERDACDLLVSLGLYKIRRFLNGGLRLRTACDLAPQGEVQITSPPGFVLPDEPQLLAAVQRSIKACGSKGLFAKPPVTQITTEVVLKKAGEDRSGESNQREVKDEKGSGETAESDE